MVSSSSLRSIGYDAPARTLEVEFANGRVYRFAPVPHEVWHALRRADSKGKYFRDFVRDRFAHERVA